jgi:hypothetical protein
MKQSVGLSAKDVSTRALFCNIGEANRELKLVYRSDNLKAFPPNKAVIVACGTARAAAAVATCLIEEAQWHTGCEPRGRVRFVVVVLA